MHKLKESLLKNFRKESYDYSTNTTGMFNVGYRINEKNKLSYNLLYVNSSNQQKDEYKGYIRDIAEDDNGIINVRHMCKIHFLLINY